MSDELLRQIKLNGALPGTRRDHHGRQRPLGARARAAAAVRPQGRDEVGAGGRGRRARRRGRGAHPVRLQPGELAAARRRDRRADGACSQEYIAREMAELKAQGVTVRFLGDLDRLSRGAAGGGRPAHGPDRRRRRSWRSTSASPTARAPSSPGPRACWPRRSRRAASIRPTSTRMPSPQRLYTAPVARSRPADPHLRRAAALQFPAVAAGLRRDLRHPGPVARLPSSSTCSRPSWSIQRRDRRFGKVSV